MKHQQLLLVVFAFLFTVACIWLLSSTTVIGAMAVAFLGAIGAYTTLDLRAIVKATGTLPPGSYQIADKWKYIIGIILLGTLFILCLIKQTLTGLDLEFSYGVLGPGIVAIITVVIGGMKLNKAATLTGPPAADGPPDK